MNALNFDATAVTPAKVWSPYQEAIFDFVANGEGNAIIEAVAGSGKSTTIKEACNVANGSTIFLAFNKAIADELKRDGVNARTFHSICFGPVMSSKGQREPSFNKVRDICKSELSGEDYFMYGSFIGRMIGLARQVGIGVLEANTESAWWNIAAHHDIEPNNDNASMERGIELAQEMFQVCISSDEIDFDDMLYFAVKDGISLPKYDFIFVDEAQDTNAIQRAILRKMMRKGSRLIAVGDPAQAIYGFRGADSDSIDQLAYDFRAIRLPLTITYRCPLSVVRYAQQWVSHIEAAPTAEEGEVTTKEAWEPSEFRPNDLVVCRTTAPLVSTAFRFIRDNVPVQVMGREIGDDLKKLVDKMGARDIDKLLIKLEAYRTREIEKAVAKDNEAKAEAIADKVYCLEFMIENLKEGRRTIKDLKAGIDYLFADKTRAVKFATIHKSKGLEANRVWWLNRSQCPAKWVRQDWQRQQEINLCYVAATRAREALFLIEDR